MSAEETIPCGCGPIAGVLWPWATDGDDSQDWVERCDDCQVYPDDEAAAAALAQHLGVAVRHARLHDDGREAPYIDAETAALAREARQEALLDVGPILAEYRRAKGE